MLNGTATASFLMDHGRVGPPGVLGGKDGACNIIKVNRDNSVYIPPHLSKAQGVEIRHGDSVTVSSPGGGGYGDPLSRKPNRVLEDVRRNYYTREQAQEYYGVAVTDTLTIDEISSRKLRKSVR